MTYFDATSLIDLHKIFLLSVSNLSNYLKG